MHALLGSFYTASADWLGNPTDSLKQVHIICRAPSPSPSTEPGVQGLTEAQQLELQERRRALEELEERF
jgi:hypothetical protein